ncbi:site-specific integrase [Bradyrhizobium septentrionale]|uniref:tyrosine-type recombinase/integrase n=1 Tax=Bradyrhizobium septentrionale TaxID=1404411 RepID=UPI001597184B|nr:site-specific integrase [Bradyrhizobium septentrionale]UGY25458.1 site-specific integrase [Bradyrhizobium septentrionale]
MITRLTKRNVDAIVPGDRAVIAYDQDLKGFGLRVAITGRWSWFVEYRPGAGGRRVLKKRMYFGSPEFTPEEARQAAKEMLASVALGGDPAAERKQEREAETFRDFAERYLKEEAKAKLKPGTVANYRIAIRKHAAPEIGSTKLNRITTAQIAQLHKKVGETKPMTANRVMECISSIFRYAATCNLVPVGHNPTQGIRAFREQRRERFLNSEELARLGETIREAETVGIPFNTDPKNPKSKHTPKNGSIQIDAHTAAALRLLILTGARLREILDLRWEFVDYQRGLLLLPDSKTGRKAIVLNGPALDVLRSLDQTGEWVIKSEGEDRPRADMNRPWRTISARAKLTDVRIHDLRHTHASIGAGAGLGLPIIGRLLGHTQAATPLRYAHLDSDPLVRASNLIGNKISVAMGDGFNKPRSADQKARHPR